jgi:glyoxylase-like metal-dependent hydrolase (beta-lactamase superfamily II)
MRIEQTGKIEEDFYVIGNAGVPVYLLDGAMPVLFDAGVTVMAGCYADDLQRILGLRMPAYLFLTHSHFDHIGSASYLKSLYPRMKVAGSAHIGEVLENPRAVRVITELNREAARYAHASPDSTIYDGDFEPFTLDVVLESGDAIDLSDGGHVEAISAPGHTWDFMSYWIPEKRILVGSEAVGCDDGTGYIYTEFLVDYDVYRRSLERLARLDMRVLCPGHKMVLTGPDAREYLRRSEEQASGYLAMVEEFLMAEHGDIERAIARVKAVEWDPKPFPKQVKPAYLLNTQARVQKIWERMQSRGNAG